MKKIFLLSLMILSMLCASASAHILYTTETGGLGLIKVDSVTSVDNQGIKYPNNDKSVVASYWENNTSNGAGNSKIILITPKTSSDTSVSGDTAVRFSSYESLKNPVDGEAIYLAGTYERPVICGTNSGGSLYLASGATLREYKTSDFRLYNTYTYPSDDFAPNPKIKSVVKTDSRVYVLAALNNNKNLSNDVVMVLDGTLNPNSEYSGRMEVRTSSDVYTMDFISDSRLAVGCANGVYYVKDSSTTTGLVSSDAPVIALHKDTGSGFYYITVSDDENVKLYHYTASTTAPGTLIKTVSGDKAYIAKDSNYDVLGVIMGDEISIIGMENGNVIAKYTSADLGSNLPISIAASSTTGNSADTSSGCMIGGAGLALMAALIFALRHKEAD